MKTRGASDSQDLVNVFAIIRPSRNATVDVAGTCDRLVPSLRQFKPSVVKSSINDQVNTPPSFGIPIIHITRNDHRSPTGLSLNVTQQLQILRMPRILIPLVVTSISMQVIYVNFNAIGDLHTHESESLWRETISLVDEAFIPCHAVKIGEGEFGECIEAGADRDVA
jgi:hypothetical protein